MKKYLLTDCPVKHLINQIPPIFNENILKDSRIIHFTKNEYLNHEGDTFDYLFFILSGKTKILRNEPNGKQRIAQFLSAGDFIGDLALVKGEKKSSDILAIGEVWTFAIPQVIAQEELYYDVQFLQTIARHIAQKMLLRTDHFTKNQSFSLKYRLAMLLLEFSTDNIYEEKHEQIADYLGTSYRHLTYTLKWLRDNQYISKQKKGYLIFPDKLKQLIAEANHY
ncbi:cyclic nucleotide-binding domain-containing protein [Enterococcus columbae]|uniref:Cyclic nucleotide-binding domain-containing protein n=1 Tax=Enterococcus columbae DSM 7374 = ATCC 51263 TaxID=1121865 RepID=S0KH78_9ENTE|nr:cyclic nucleotide-binding domain-containing protein [Enterococcus columbae]EOT38501.1 hypothetical protein OMW_02141 [Enterococcus columbae DSM 7374 = ATCC 51263]EOW87848.1 hypothetical protein I568_00134 [Enterococcus columbae DSM 7374 = ATCC 51263]OJG22956.1 hypothetical protein RR47_GL000672 [Enterococcus columbae DSM 7374 = ATCC 51263]